ncbi:MAG: PAS domain S-box protein [Solidesulfovibrio sp. DCME]|uniref:ATP-binding protein n=1 Tax=Solidesulfovibrio sp. DCME TaxID=3447380 RepID=UPI003D0A06BE
MPQASPFPRPFPTRQAYLLLGAGVCLYLVLGSLLLAANSNARRFHDHLMRAEAAIDGLRLAVEQMHHMALLAAATGEQEFVARHGDARASAQEQLRALERQARETSIGAEPQRLARRTASVEALQQKALAHATRYEQGQAWAILRGLGYEEALGLLRHCLDDCDAASAASADNVLTAQERHNTAALWCVAVFTPLFGLAGHRFVRRARRDTDTAMAAQAALAASERRFRDTFELAAVGIAHVSLEGAFLRVNSRFAAITGFSPQELTATGFAAITHPQDINADMASVGRLLAGEIATYSMEKRYLRKDGATVWVQLTVSLARDQDDAPLHFISVIEDISARKRAEASARQNAQTLAALLDATLDRVFLTDADGHVLAANQAAATGLGLTPNETVGRRFHDLFTEELAASRLTHLRRALETGRIQRFTDERDGIVFDNIIAPLPESDTLPGRRAAMFARDATALVRAREEAEAASRAKSLFLANLGHEIRTPLNGILGMAQVLAGLSPSEEQRQCLDDIASASTALLTLMTDLLDLALLETGQVTLEEACFSLGGILEAVTAEVGHRAAAKGLEYTVDTAPDLPPLVYADGDKLRRIVLALAANAVKFTREGRVTVTARCREACPDEESGATGMVVAIAVADTGIGIAGDSLERIFEAFAQGDGSATRRFGGAGLGLAIARRLARLMGGDITVESSPGQGSRFSLALPLRLSAPSLTPEATA